jgi:hypothetical protein
MEAARSSETLVSNHNITQSNNPENQEFCKFQVSVERAVTVQLSEQCRLLTYITRNFIYKEVKMGCTSNERNKKYLHNFGEEVSL